MSGARRRARILALQILYELNSSGHNAEKVLLETLEKQSLSDENKSFVRELVTGVIEHREQIDRYIRKYAPTWPLEQIPVVDRNILRLAIFEILIDNKVPVKAAINEAVELAKLFGSDSSYKFVNGVLGSVNSSIGR
jgi:N utilization substance protein B